MLKHILEENKNLKIIGQEPKTLGDTQDLLTKDCNKILHTNIQLDLFQRDPESEGLVYRVKDSLGFTTPSNGDGYPDPLEIDEKEDGNEKFVIIDDVGNGFRENKNRKKWPKALKEEGKKPYVVYMMYPPLFKGELWEHVLKNHKERIILVINADDLRQMGVNISRSLSWEKTALEFLWEIKRNPILKEIANLRNVIVRFKVEGVVHYNVKDNKIKPMLYFDPSKLEGNFWDFKKCGEMRGISTVFLSSLASKLITSYLKDGKISDEIIDESIKEGIKFGMIKSYRFLEIGHSINKKSKDDVGNPEFFDCICKNLFNNRVSDTPRFIPGQWRMTVNCKVNSLSSTELPTPEDSQGKSEPNISSVELPIYGNYHYEADPYFWSILKYRTKREKEELENFAVDIVEKGRCVLKDIPTVRFGKLVTVDREEMESYRSIMSIMKEYINSNKISIPLSIAVFGAPGSGKSFGITQVAENIDSERIDKLEFNVSQFTSPKDLVNAFHRVRDSSLEGKIPLVFFDEFDCTFEDRSLGWLRYFLLPMQEGKFLDSGNIHPIGKSIFVFAGGIYKNFREFCESNGVGYNSQRNSSVFGILKSQELAIEKCPDFVSRLRGYVNILGPNKIDEDKNSDAYIIRRAIILRTLIKEKVPNIMEPENKFNKENRKRKARIDPSLIKALIKISKYKHGVRSMEAIIDMSMLGKQKKWVKSSLPPKDQLELHVDGAEFLKLLAESFEDDFKIEDDSKIQKNLKNCL